MPEYLYRVRPARAGFYESPTSGEIRAVDQHFLYLKRSAEEGTVLLAGRTLNEDPSGFGIVIFEAPDERKAHRFMMEDPAVLAGVFEAELFPYRVALRSSRWGS
ncbi:MAG: YciI family protein [Candidatus Bipolaricaulia bacterium]